MSGRNWIVIGAVIVALVGGFFIGQAVLGDDDDDGERIVRISTGPTGASDGAQPQTELSIDDDGQTIGDDEIRAIGAAATKATGGGTVSDIERSDDPGEAFEVEVLKD